MEDSSHFHCSLALRISSENESFYLFIRSACRTVEKSGNPYARGCVIGNRPIDLHVRALQGLGADVHLSGGIVKVDGKNISGNSIFIGGRHGSTVTGTANAIMLAVLTPGHSVLEGSACEPEITDPLQHAREDGSKN